MREPFGTGPTSGSAGSGFPCPYCQSDVHASAEACPSCGRPPVVCGYRVRELLGRGGMGVVLGATREADGVPAAIKVLWLGKGVDWKAYELFERSTRVLQGLEHPGLPRVRAFEKTDDGSLLLVRDRFDGGSLHERIAEPGGRLDPDSFVRLLRRMLELLVYLHGQVPPVLHRDIKPDNVLFRTPDDWDPVLVDFDTVAAPGSQRGRLTVVCTPGFTAPEQLAGDVSPASDLYSLGATMLFVATRANPDDLPRRDGRFQVDDLLSPLPPAVRGVVLRLVEPSKAERHARAEDALRDLDAAEHPRRRQPAAPAVEPAVAEALSRRAARILSAPTWAERRPKTKPGAKQSSFVWLAGLVGAGTLAVMLGLGWWLASADGEKAGVRKQSVLDVAFAVVFDDDGAPPVVDVVEKMRAITEDGSRDSTRLTILDLATGAVLSRVSLGDGEADVKLLGRGPGFFWMNHDVRGPEARDGRTGALLVDLAGLARINPELRGNLPGDRPAPEGFGDRKFMLCGSFFKNDGWNRELVVRTRDGHVYRIAPTTWAARRTDEDWYGIATWDGVQRAYSAGAIEVEIGTTQYRLVGHPRARLAKGEPTPAESPSPTQAERSGTVLRVTTRTLDGSEQASVDFVPLPGGTEFLEAQILGLGSDQPWLLHDPDGVLVQHNITLDVGAPRLLSRVGLDGKEIWRWEGREIQGATGNVDVYLAGDRLLVLKEEGTAAATTFRAAAVDLATGRTIWTHAF